MISVILGPNFSFNVLNSDETFVILDCTTLVLGFRPLNPQMMWYLALQKGLRIPKKGNTIFVQKLF